MKPPQDAPEKAVEGHRTPRRWRDCGGVGLREVFRGAPGLWRFWEFTTFFIQL